MGLRVSKGQNHAYNVHRLRGRQYSYRSALIFHPSLPLIVSDRLNSLLGTHGDQGRSIAAHLLALLGHTGDVGAAGDVPHGDVLLHAAGQATALLGR